MEYSHPTLLKCTSYISSHPLTCWLNSTSLERISLILFGSDRIYPASTNVGETKLCNITMASRNLPLNLEEEEGIILCCVAIPGIHYHTETRDAWRGMTWYIQLWSPRVSGDHRGQQWDLKLSNLHIGFHILFSFTREWPVRRSSTWKGKSNTQVFIISVMYKCLEKGDRGKVEKEGRTIQTSRAEALVILIPSSTRSSNWAVLLLQKKNVRILP